MKPLAQAGAALLGGTLASARPLHGGDLSSVMHIKLQDGRQAVLKTGPAPKTEAAMLQALQAANAPVPQILAVNDRILALEFIPAGGSLNDTWPHLGRTLAALHKATSPHYGWAENYAFGEVTIENARSENWPDFFAQHRLLTHAAKLPPDLARRVENLARNLGKLLPAHPRPALLHGDLWGGNILATERKIAAFIDPACFFGHAEADLAMLHLFDRPTPAFHDSYGPLEPGAAERRPIYALWPALVHLRLFGAAYRRMVEAFLLACGV